MTGQAQADSSLVIGAPLYHYVSTACAFFVAGLIKVIVTVMFCFNESKTEQDRIDAV